MSIKESLFNYLKINQLKDNVSQYVEARIRLLKMDIEDRAVGVVEDLVYLLVKLIFIMFTGGFLLQLLGSLLNKFFNSFWVGPAVCFAICVVVLLGWITFEKGIRKKIQAALLKKIEEQKSDD